MEKTGKWYKVLSRQGKLLKFAHMHRSNSSKSQTMKSKGGKMAMMLNSSIMN